MPLTPEDIEALGKLLDIKFDERLSPFREEVMGRFAQVDASFEELFSRDEKREQEYLLLREQMKRLEKKCA